MLAIFLNFMIPLFVIVTGIFFLISQQRTLQAVQKVNRRMAPGLIWLQAIPFFGWLWQFVVVISISNSIRREFMFENNDSVLGIAQAAATEGYGKKPTLGSGLAYCILIIPGEILTRLSHAGTPHTAMLGLISLGAGLICWIVYWVSLNRYRRQLQLFQS